MRRRSLRSEDEELDESSNEHDNSQLPEKKALSEGQGRGHDDGGVGGESDSELIRAATSTSIRHRRILSAALMRLRSSS